MMYFYKTRYAGKKVNIFQKLKDKIKKKLSLAPLLTLAGFVLFLGISWFYISQPSIEEEEQMHGLLQDKFQTLISNFVANKHPEVNQIVFHKVWTKNTSDPNQIEIFFNYSLFTEGPEGGELFIIGESILEKSQEQEDLWTVQNFKVTDSSVGFSEPLIIKGSLPQKEVN